MNIITLAWKNILARPLNLILSMILFGLGIGLIHFLLLVNDQLTEKFDNNLAEIDLVIGAKGSPLQLILCNMYHIDNPTGNIKIDTAKPFLNPKHPVIKASVPLSLGDSYKAYRIIGTTHQFLDFYNAEIDQGSLFQRDNEVVLGSIAAANTGLKIGSTFTSSHGFEEESNLEHDHSKLKVVGVMKPSGSVADQLILTGTATIWNAHNHEEPVSVESEKVIVDQEEHHHDHDAEGGHDHETFSHDHAQEIINDHEDHDHDDHEGHEHDDHEGHDHENHAGHDHEHHDHAGHDHSGHGHIHTMDNADLLQHPEESITSILVRYKNRSSIPALNMPRGINENTDLQAASPAYEINKLFSLIGVGTDALRWLAIIIAFVSAISIFISLFKSLKERKYELALLRVSGASPSKIFFLIISEGLIMGFIGWLAGMLISYIGYQIFSGFATESYKYSFDQTFIGRYAWILLVISLLIGLVAAIIPGMMARRDDIHNTLSQS